MPRLPKKLPRDDHKQASALQRPLRIWYAGAWRTPEAAERKRREDAASKRRRWAAKDSAYRAAKIKYRESVKLDPIKLEEERKRKREFYAANRKKCNDKRTAWARSNRARNNANQRNSYARKHADRLSKIYARRDRRNPHRPINRAIREFREGRLSIRDLANKIREQIDVVAGDLRLEFGDGPGEGRRRRS